MKLKGQILDDEIPVKHGKQYTSLIHEIWGRSHELLEACDRLSEEGKDAGTKRNTFAKAKAKAFLLQGTGKNKEEREANADAGYEKERLESFLADAASTAQLERVRSLRQVISALQTLVNGAKAEADAFYFGQTE